jgi:hypothetical protein
MKFPRKLQIGWRAVAEMYQGNAVTVRSMMVAPMETGRTGRGMQATPQTNACLFSVSAAARSACTDFLVEL